MLLFTSFFAFNGLSPSSSSLNIKFVSMCTFNGGDGEDDVGKTTKLTHGAHGQSWVIKFQKKPYKICIFEGL